MIINGGFDTMKKVLDPVNKLQDRTYVRAIQSKKNTLTSMCLMKLNTKKLYEIIVEKLNTFPRLKSLKIHIKTKSMKEKKIHEMHQFFN